jgi:NADPH:quinone reductase
MRAAWYERRGPAREVLIVGEMPDPQPGPGEVRLAVAVSGLSPGDIKKRAGWQGAPMEYPRIIPHSDGAGVIDAVGPGVDQARVGRPAWCYGAQSYRQFGTAAELVVVPSELAVDLPPVEDPNQAGTLAEQAACLGIAGITAHRAIFGDGSVAGLDVLIHGAAGGVGSIATQMARRDRARVIAVVRPGQEARALELRADHVFLSDAPDLAHQIREVAPNGVHRIAEVDFASHIDLDASVIAIGGVISSYSTSDDNPPIPYWQLGFADTTVHLLGSDDFPAAVKAIAATDLTDALAEGSLRSSIAARVPLADIATAHEMVEQGARGRVVVVVSDESSQPAGPRPDRGQ